MYVIIIFLQMYKCNVNYVILFQLLLSAGTEKSDKWLGNVVASGNMYLPYVARSRAAERSGVFV